MNLLTQCCGLSLLIIQFIFIRSQKSLKLYRERIFMWVLEITAFSVICDILSVVFISLQQYFPSWLVHFVCKLYVVALTWDGWCAYIYMMLDLIPHRRYRNLVLYMAIFNQMVSLVTFILPINIVYDGNGVLYTEGPSTLVAYSAAVIYSCLIVFTCLKQKNKMNPRKKLGMLLWVTFLFFAAGIQFFQKQILIISFAMSFGALIIFVLMENPEANIDKRLGCFNSYAKSMFISSLWDEGRDFSMLKICFNQNMVIGLTESDRLFAFQHISNILSAWGKSYVFKENDAAFSVISTDREALEKHVKEVWSQICGHDPLRGRATMMLLRNPYLLEEAAEIENVFSFAMDEGLADVYTINIIDENTARMFRVRKLLVEDPSIVTEFADEAAFLSNREKRLKSLEIIDLFASEYAAVYHVDMVTGVLTTYTMNSDTVSNLSKPFSNGMQFRDAYNLFTDTFVYSDDREMFKTACTLEKINAELQAHKSYSIIFRCVMDETNKPLYCEMKFMKLGGAGEELSAFVLGIANRDDAIKRERAEALQRAQYHAVIQALSSEYGSIYYADFSTNLIIPYAASDRVSEHVGTEALQDVTFEGAVLAYINSIVAEDDKDLMRGVLTIENIRRELSDKQYFTQIYHNEIGQYCEMKCVRTDELHPVVNVVVGFAVKDDEIRKRLAQERQLKEALEAAEVANRSKTDFLFNMSHDIRTPMNAITGFTRMAIRDIHEPEKALDHLDKTQKASDMLLSLINDILDMSRIESGNVKLNEQFGDIKEMFDGLEPILRELAKDKNIAMTFSADNVSDRFVFYDAMRTQRILVNIISNAIKYTLEGGWVKISCTESERDAEGRGVYVFTVEDNGIGMSEEFQAHLFEQFSREENASTSKIQGTGLGLALCKSLTELMGGTIGAVSAQGVGSKFTVTLPLRIANENISTQYCEKGKDVVNENIFFGRRVLLVDDNELNREIAEDILSETGLAVESAESGKDAVNMIRQNAAEYYDFVLMDIQMPVMNGYEATVAIRKLMPDRHIPIIALSANAFEEDKQKSIAAGMDDHVAKPIKVDELKAVIAKFM